MKQQQQQQQQRQQQQQQQQIEQLKHSQDVLQFALPNGGRGFVTKSNTLLLAINGDLISFGNFKKSKSDGAFYFIYKAGDYDIPEEIHALNKELRKDLYAFAVVLGYFFDNYPNYKNTRYHDSDVLLDSSSTYLHTPLYKVGFIVKAYS